MDGSPLIGVAQERVGALGGVDTLAAPNGIDDLLTRRALDKVFCLAHDGHLDRVADASLVVELVKLGTSLEDIWGSTFEDGPGRNEDAGEFEDVGELA